MRVFFFSFLSFFLSLFSPRTLHGVFVEPVAFGSVCEIDLVGCIRTGALRSLLVGAVLEPSQKAEHVVVILVDWLSWCPSLIHPLAFLGERYVSGLGLVSEEELARLAAQICACLDC